MTKIIKTLLIVMVIAMAIVTLSACSECEHTGGTATCTAQAVCELCGKSYGELAAHNEAITAPVQPTCEEAGLSGSTHCADCNAVIVAAIEIPALGHSYTEATCTAPAKCEECGHVNGEALGHADADGNYVCDVCKEKLHENVIVVGEGNKIVVYGDTLNNWNLPIEWVVFYAEAAGTYTFTGDNSALVYVFDLDGNSLCGYTGVATLEAGAYAICVGNGATGVMNVTVTFEAATAPAPHEHEYAEDVTKPTCTAAGYTTYTCACGDTYTGNEVAATGHDYDHVVTAPTCTAAGYTTHTCAFCDDSYTDSEVEATGHVDANADYKCDSCSTKMLPADGTTLTIPQALAVAKVAGTSYTTEKYYITGKIKNVYNTTYGNMYIVDEDGNELCIYGLYTWDKAVRYDAMTYKPVAGDEVTVYTVLGAYNTTYQGKDAWLDDVVAHEHDYKSVVTDPTCLAAGYTTHTCSICSGSYVDTEVDALGHTTEEGECERCGQTIGSDAPVVGTLAEFTFGSNGTASHVDGNEYGTSKSFTSGTYTLALTGMSKVYGPAYDAKGNSCIKLGTSKVVGSFSFTVPENVTEVVIYVAKYKSNSTTINVNGTNYTLTKNSNDGAYDVITVDTTTTKTVTLTTVASTYRAMVNTIVFNGYAQ